jgi:hypothetical protein
MQKLLIVFTSMALPVAATAQFFDSCGATPVVSTEEKGKRIELILDGAAVAKTQSWTPTSGEPPLSVSKAAAAALAWAKIRLRSDHGVELEGVQLLQSLESLVLPSGVLSHHRRQQAVWPGKLGRSINGRNRRRTNRDAREP